MAALTGSKVPALAGLRTRSSGDFSIALIDAWSEVLDILTFYTERLANEAYLGTAIEARSVFELARLVGYKPSPGVSASTVLAFTLATAHGIAAHRAHRRPEPACRACRDQDRRRRSSRQPRL